MPGVYQDSLNGSLRETKSIRVMRLTLMILLSLRLSRRSAFTHGNGLVTCPRNDWPALPDVHGERLLF